MEAISRKGGSAGVALAGALLALLGTSAAIAPNVLRAAEHEGVVVWYTTMLTGDVAATVKAFEASHPGITVKTLRLGSSQLPARVVTEQRSGHVIADVVSGDESQVAQIVAAGGLQPNPNPDAREFIPGTVDPSALWSSLYQNTTVLAWNPARLKADGLTPPKDLADLAKPEWRGKIGVDAEGLNWYVGLLEAQPGAERLVQSIAANQPVMTMGHTDSMVRLESGEIDASPTAYGYLVDRERAEGRPIDFRNPQPLLVTLNPIGMTKGAPHPNAARVLIDWLLSKEGQTFLTEHGGGEISARRDVQNNPRLWNARQRYFIVRPPDQSRYGEAVRQFKAIFGMPD